MPIYRHMGKLIYFSHIPKCAGTSLTVCLERRFGKPAFQDRDHISNPRRKPWTRTSPQHIDKESLGRLFPEDFFDLSFAVVRDPVSRLKSVYLFQKYKERSIPKWMGFTMWLLLLEKGRRFQPYVYDNHVRPQTEFLVPGARIFKLEEGLGNVVSMLDEFFGGLGTALPLLGLYGLAGKQLIPAFHKIFSAVASIRFGMASVDAVLDDLGSRLDSTPLPEAGTWPQPIAPGHAIALEHVSYRYPKTERDALQDLNMRIPARTTVGFIGASGAGKSTLIDIVLGLLEPDQGRIVVDSQPLGRHNMRGWQAALGYVPQHIFLADQSVAANIALGLLPEEIDMDAVIRAAEMANLHDFVITDLPQGYNTIIGERGVRLSGGQRQRIGIARALYRNPSVLLFDEATSALDNATEQAVMEAIYRLSSEKTIILVAHRLSTVQACQRIYILSQGKVVEEGSWEELTTSEGEHFKRLSVGHA